MKKGKPVFGIVLVAEESPVGKAYKKAAKKATPKKKRGKK